MKIPRVDNGMCTKVSLSPLLASARSAFAFSVLGLSRISFRCLCAGLLDKLENGNNEAPSAAKISPKKYFSAFAGI
jgi:hypothetical protein